MNVNISNKLFLLRAILQFRFFSENEQDGINTK